jgi:hypothetical protein
VGRSVRVAYPVPWFSGSPKRIAQAANHIRDSLAAMPLITNHYGFQNRAVQERPDGSLS